MSDEVQRQNEADIRARELRERDERIAYHKAVAEGMERAAVICCQLGLTMTAQAIREAKP